MQLKQYQEFTDLIIYIFDAIYDLQQFIFINTLI
jgi:hypothetical protein